MKKTLMLSAALLGAAAVVAAADAQPTVAQSNAAPVAAPAFEAPAPATAEQISKRFDFLPEVVAEYNGKKLLKSDVVALFASRNIPEKAFEDVPESVLRNAAQQAINSIVDEDILLAAAEKAGFKPSKELCLKQFDAGMKGIPPEQLQMIEQTLKQQGKTLQDFKDELAAKPEVQKDAAIAAYLESVLEKNKAAVTDADVEKFYRENQKDFETPENVVVAHILVKSMDVDDKGAKIDADTLAKNDAAAKEKADKIYADVQKDPSKFAEIAKQQSDCPSKSDGGKLPAFEKDGSFVNGMGQMETTFTNAAYELQKPGDFSKPVKTPFGYHIIMLQEKNPVGFVPLEQLKEPIREELTMKKNNETVQELLTNARKDAGLKINEFKPAAAPAPAAAAPETK